MWNRNKAAGDGKLPLNCYETSIQTDDLHKIASTQTNIMYRIYTLRNKGTQTDKQIKNSNHKCQTTRPNQQVFKKNKRNSKPHHLQTYQPRIKKGYSLAKLDKDVFGTRHKKLHPRVFSIDDYCIQNKPGKVIDYSSIQSLQHFHGNSCEVRLLKERLNFVKNAERYPNQRPNQRGYQTVTFGPLPETPIFVYNQMLEENTHRISRWIEEVREANTADARYIPNKLRHDLKDFHGQSSENMAHNKNHPVKVNAHYQKQSIKISQTHPHTICNNISIIEPPTYENSQENKSNLKHNFHSNIADHHARNVPGNTTQETELLHHMKQKSNFLSVVPEEAFCNMRDSHASDLKGTSSIENYQDEQRANNGKDSFRTLPIDQQNQNLSEVDDQNQQKKSNDFNHHIHTDVEKQQIYDPKSQKQSPESTKVKKMSNCILNQYKNLSDDTFDKSYRMMQELKKVLELRGVFN